VLPAETETTGIAFHFDQPSSEPPQSMLLVLPTTRAGAWQWDDVVDALHDTLALARARAVEPAQIDASRYAAFLPATVSAVTLYEMSIVANLGINNDVYNFIAR
jgi:alkyl sulfatase BDS1-like metallo-beta-lactamase superfamily hydrolase